MEFCMPMSFSVEAPPLSTDPDGVVRITGTRVPLDTVISAFVAGATAEEISQQFPSLALAEVYQVVAYYLRRPLEIESYMRGRRQHSEASRVSNEQRFDPAGVRARLLARRGTRNP
jgi:uncharacterized protein (DUF433 family)